VAGIAQAAPGVRILAASLRSVDQVAEVAAAGAHDLTLAPAIAHALFEDVLTLAASAEFEALVAASAPGAVS
jgi:transaldolase